MVLGEYLRPKRFYNPWKTEEAEHWTTDWLHKKEILFNFI